MGKTKKGECGMTKTYSLRLSAKDKGVKIFNNHDENNWRVLNLHFNDYEDAQFVRGKLEPVVDLLNKLNDENEQLKHNNKMLSMKMSEVSTKYRLLYEFSEDTNPNEAVKTVLHELMMITKEYR